MRKSSLLFIALACTLVASMFLLLRNSQANKTDQNAQSQKEREARALLELEWHKRRRMEKVPEVVNKTHSLRITNMEIVRGEISDDLHITFRNNSEKAINSFTLCYHIDEYGWTSETSLAPPGQALIEPHGEFPKLIPAAAFRPNVPLTICALMFVDETDEGTPEVRESRRESNERRKQEAGKEKP